MAGSIRWRNIVVLTVAALISGSGPSRANGAPKVPVDAVVYVADAPDGQALLAIAANGNDPVTLATAGVVTFLSWSPDGSKVAVLRAKRAKEPDVVVLDVVKGKQHTIMKQASGFETLRWSPDGTKVLVRRGYDVDTFEATGSGRHRVTPKDSLGRGFVWAGVGSNVLFPQNGADGVTDVLSVDANGKKSVRLVHDADDPVPSPDGRTIAFRRCTHDRNQALIDCDLWTVAADGSAARQLTKGPSIDGIPSWSPDGRRLAFARFGGGAAKVVVITNSGADVREVVAAPEGPIVWAPDSASIAYEQGLSDDPIDSARDTRVVSLATPTAPVRRVDGCDLSWSPDGSQVAYRARCTNSPTMVQSGDLMVADANGSGRRRVASGTSIEWRPQGSVRS